MQSKPQFNMTIIPKLNAQDAFEEVIRMTGLSTEEYCSIVENRGNEYAQMIALEKVNDPAYAHQIGIALTMYLEFWQFYRNQVYLLSLEFIYNWYHIELSENGKAMNRTVFSNTLKSQRIKARPMFRVFKSVFIIPNPNQNETTKN